MNRALLLDFLQRIDILSLYDKEDLLALLQDTELKSYKTGEIVFSQGDAGDKFYIVYSGQIRIFLKKDTGEEINLGIRSRKDHFGETALITDSPRNAGARAVEDSVLLTVGNEAFRRYLLSRPEQREYFTHFIQSTSIFRFIKSFTDLSSIPPKELKELVLNFKAQFYQKDSAIFRQGDAGDRFYLLEHGKLKVSQWNHGEETILAVLSDGAFFGEKALFENTVRAADIVCLTDCNLYSLKKRFLITWLINHPNCGQSSKTVFAPIPNHVLQ